MTTSDVEGQRRVAAITAYGAVKVASSELSDVVELAARIAGAPFATINLLTDSEQHSVSAYGFDGAVCRLQDSMCSAVLVERRPIIVSDASLDPRFRHNPFVTGELASVRFYASYPLSSHEGVIIGALCVFDEVVKPADVEVLRGLATLAARVVDVYELRLRSRELALSLMEIAAVQAELERSNERLASFAGQVSHDLKTPLTTLSLSLSLIREQVQDGTLGPESAQLLDRAVNGSVRMAGLIDDVLDYATLGGTLRTTDVDLGFVLGEALEDVGSELGGADLDIGPLPTVSGDRSQLRAVLQNLLANAAKYRQAGRPLEISVQARHVQRAWRIEITDNGRGVAASERRRVFEPLARIDDAVRGVDGSGIGLATCRRIIGAHGGSIGIDPSVTEGTRFWFELPD